MQAFVTSMGNLNAGFMVAITIEAKPGKGDEVARILESLTAPTMREEKVKFFVPYRSTDNPLSFFVYELYTDKNGWDEHNKSKHFLAVVDELVSLCAKRQRIPFAPFNSAHEAG